MFEYIKEWKDCVIYQYTNALPCKPFPDIEKSNKKKKTKNKNLWIIYKKTKRVCFFVQKY